MRTALAGFQLEGNGGSWSPRAGGDGWSGGGGGCGGDCGCGGQCGGDCGCKGGGASCGGKPSGGCGDKPSGGCGGKPSGVGGGLGGGLGQLPLIPDYDGDIWDATLPSHGDTWPGVGQLGSVMTYADGSYGGGGETPVLPAGRGITKLLFYPDEPLRSQNPVAVVANGCCCVKRLCLVKAPAQKNFRNPRTLAVEEVPAGFVSSPFFMIVEYDLLAEEGGDCSFEWKETNKGQVVPAGYREWKPGEWNSYKKNTLVQPFFDQQWLVSRNAQLDDKMGALQRGQQDPVTIPTSDEFMIFMAVKSGCRSAQCKSCCFLINVSVAQGDIVYRVSGSCDGAICGSEPSLGVSSSLADDFGEWAWRVAVAGQGIDFGMGSKISNFLTSNATLSDGKAGKVCVL